MEKISDLSAGKAGEYLVCADIILSGHTAFLSEQGLPFDVIADIDGRLLRIQVKTTRATRAVPQRRANHTPAYLFHINKCGKFGKQNYKEGDVDIFALVALDTKDIGFLPAKEVRKTMILRSRNYKGMYYDEILKVRCDKIRDLKNQGFTNSYIAHEMKLDLGYIGKVLNGKSGLKDTLETYLCDMTLKKALEAI